jgi:hypothetical protein
VPGGSARDQEQDNDGARGEDDATNLTTKLDDGLRYTVTEAISADARLKASFIACSAKDTPRADRQAAECSASSGPRRPTSGSASGRNWPMKKS